MDHCSELTPRSIVVRDLTECAKGLASGRRIGMGASLDVFNEGTRCDLTKNPHFIEYSPYNVFRDPFNLRLTS